MLSTSAVAMAAALKTAAIIFDNGIDAVPTSPRAWTMIADTFDWLAEESKKTKSLSRQETMAFFGCRLTRLLKMTRDNELESYVDGGTRRYPLASICKRQIALALLSYPLDGDAPKARVPKQLIRKRPVRARTENELRALKRANDRSHEEKLARLARKRGEETRA